MLSRFRHRLKAIDPSNNTKFSLVEVAEGGPFVCGRCVNADGDLAVAEEATRQYSMAKDAAAARRLELKNQLAQLKADEDDLDAVAAELGLVRRAFPPDYNEEVLAQLRAAGKAGNL
jgi:hypothetical protein